MDTINECDDTPLPKTLAHLFSIMLFCA